MLTLIAEGAQVANANRSTAEGESLEAVYSQLGQHCLSLKVDLSEADACQRVVNQTLENCGRLDVVVNNAEVNDGIDLEAGPDAILESLQRNLIHYQAIVHHALEALRQSRGIDHQQRRSKVGGLQAQGCTSRLRGLPREASTA